MNKEEKNIEILTLALAAFGLIIFLIGSITMTELFLAIITIELAKLNSKVKNE